MPITKATDLITALEGGHILEPEQLQSLCHDPAALAADPAALARELANRGWLTPYQANQLLAGHGAALALGPYVLLDRLGEGGMGEVFKARHRKLGRVVALKVIRKEWLDHPDTVRRFEREARAAAQLSHPNIVTLYDADEA